MLVVNPSFPAKTVPEFIAYAKANPGKINYASVGSGALTNVAGELFKMMAGVDMVHVPYRSNYLPDLISGQVQVMFTPIAQRSADQSRQGARAGGDSRDASAVLPDVPTVTEFVPGYEANGRIGVPANTPRKSSTNSTRRSMPGLADPR